MRSTTQGETSSARPDCPLRCSDWRKCSWDRGVALRINHAQTYLALKQLQETLKPQLRRILMILALDAGAQPATLRRFMEELTIEWENPLEMLDRLAQETFDADTERVAKIAGIGAPDDQPRSSAAGR